MRRNKVAKWRQRRTKTGKVWIIEPEPVLKNLNFDRFERGCLLLSIDPDSLLTGEFNAAELPEPSLKNARDFLDVVLTKPELYKLEEWSVEFVKIFLGIVASNFIVSSLVSSEKSRSIRKIFRSVSVFKSFRKGRTPLAMS